MGSRSSLEILQYNRDGGLVHFNGGRLYEAWQLLGTDVTVDERGRGLLLTTTATDVVFSIYALSLMERSLSKLPDNWNEVKGAKYCIERIRDYIPMPLGVGIVVHIDTSGAKFVADNSGIKSLFDGARYLFTEGCIS